MSSACPGNEQVDHDQQSSGHCGLKRQRADLCDKKGGTVQNSTKMAKKADDEMPAFGVLAQADPDHQEPDIGGKDQTDIDEPNDNETDL